MLSSAIKISLDQPAPNAAKGQPTSNARSPDAIAIDQDLIDRAAKKYSQAKKFANGKGEARQQDSQIVASTDESARQNEDKVFNIPGLFKPSFVQGRSVNTLQEWQGYILSVEEREFTALLVDLTKPSQKREQALIPIDVVEREDRGKIRLGAYFHLIIGFSRGRGGNHEKKTIIYFRRHIQKKSKAGTETASILSRLRDTYDHTADAG